MTHHATSSRIFASLALSVFGLLALATPVYAAGNRCTVDSKIPVTQCGDGIDNDGDGKIDYCGVDTNNDGILDNEPDPTCDSPSDNTESADSVAPGSLVPCTDKCTVSDVFKLINGLISFFFKTLLIPLFVIMLMYAGFQYFKANGNPGQHAKLLSMLKHMIGGLLIILLAWLVVRVIISTVLNDDYANSGVQFLGK